MADLISLPRFCVRERGPVRLTEYPTDLGDDLRKKELKASLEHDVQLISELQEQLYARGDRSLLLIFQAMDGAGKDSCIRHVMSGINPQGCRVWSFKAPNTEELAHDLLWRHANGAPAKGMIAIHNRSHYEEVLVVKVHPEYLVSQRLPGITDAKDPGHAFWEQRYRSIRSFEEHLATQGVVIMKFFLHMSRSVQKKRFMERIEEAHKNWKFNLNDVKERAHWDAYTKCYEEAIAATAAPHAPWAIVPADDQWESRAIVGRMVREQLGSMDLTVPPLTAHMRKELDEGRAALRDEKV